jgi:hypothetical protein
VSNTTIYPESNVSIGHTIVMSERRNEEDDRTICKSNAIPEHWTIYEIQMPKRQMPSEGSVRRKQEVLEGPRL